MTDRDRLLLKVALTILTLSFLIAGSNFLLTSGVFQKTPSPGSHVVKTFDSDREQMIAKLRELRSKLQSWAERNEPILRAMLQAKASDFAANQKVWDSCPAIPTPFNGNSSDLVLDGSEVRLSDLNGPVHIASICGVDRAQAAEDVRAVANDPEFWKYRHRGDVIRETRRQWFWEKYRDVPMWEAHSAGNERYFLFLSGRIVLCRVPDNGYVKKGTDVKTAFNQYEYQEIERVYPFL